MEPRVRQWVYEAYPEDKSELESIPDAYLSELYLEISELGPSGRTFKSALQTLTEIAQDKTRQEALVSLATQYSVAFYGENYRKATGAMPASMLHWSKIVLFTNEPDLARNHESYCERVLFELPEQSANFVEEAIRLILLHLGYCSAAEHLGIGTDRDHKEAWESCGVKNSRKYSDVITEVKSLTAQNFPELMTYLPSPTRNSGLFARIFKG